MKAPDNCMDCEHKRIIHDPDPHDWFCDDDCAIVCTKVEKVKEPHSVYLSDRQEYKLVTSSCRPYNKRKECTRPVWCPLLNTTI